MNNKGNAPGENFRSGTINIANMGQLRKFMVKLINEYRSGCGNPPTTLEAKCQGYLASVIRQCLLDIDVGDLKQRLDDMEAIIKNNPSRRMR